MGGRGGGDWGWGAKTAKLRTVYTVSPTPCNVIVTNWHPSVLGLMCDCVSTSVGVYRLFVNSNMRVDYFNKTRWNIVMKESFALNILFYRENVLFTVPPKKITWKGPYPQENLELLKYWTLNHKARDRWKWHLNGQCGKTFNHHVPVTQYDQPHRPKSVLDLQWFIAWRHQAIT